MRRLCSFSCFSACGPRAAAAGVLALLGVGCTRPAPPGRPWREFVAELTNTARFADLAVRGTRLLSSYDRLGGNDDFNYFEKAGSEPGWVTVADLKGPGVVRRFWFTGVEPDHPFKFYFDGERSPRIQGAAEELFGRTWPFVPPLATYMNRAWTTYVPLTYRHSLRIETRTPPIHPRWGPRKLFFQANVEALPPEAPPETYPRKLSPEDERTLRDVAEVWNRSVEWPVAAGGEPQRVEVTAGTEMEIFADVGPATLREWTLAVEPTEPEAWSARERLWMLQDIVLRVFYDGRESPSVDVPLGDFFCCGWGPRRLGSLALGVGPQGFRCALPMPYARSVRFVLRNDADRAVTATFRAAREPGISAGAGYLHAMWNKSGPERQGPHRIAHFSGAGRYAGCYLAVTSHDNSWWMLEGDEMMHLDGETSPSWHGTGLEDYFNGAWYYGCAAFSAFYGVLDMSPYRTGQYRFHLVDPVRFEKSFLMVIERGDRNVSRGVMRSVAYAYLREPTVVAPVPTRREERRADPHPLQREVIMSQLIDLERMNNFAEAADLVETYLEQYPDVPWRGVLELRKLEYERLAGRGVADGAYDPFLRGERGQAAQEQAQLLAWLREKPLERALVGLHPNARAQLFLDGRPVLAADSPFALRVAGLELSRGPHTLCVEADLAREIPWVLASVRTADGVAGTGPGTPTTLSPRAGWMTNALSATRWDRTTSYTIVQGPPNAPYLPAVPNAFVLMQSKAYAIRPMYWEDTGQRAGIRVDFEMPLTNWPAHAREVTGLAR